MDTTTIIRVAAASLFAIALVYLIFDVEVVFLFPWAIIYRNLGMFAFVEMMIFLAILFVGYAYIWLNGDLEWDKPVPEILTRKDPELFSKPAFKPHEEIPA